MPIKHDKMGIHQPYKTWEFANTRKGLLENFQ
jgi:hypothetical protein